MNSKRAFRLYDQENLKVRSVERKKISRRQRISHGPATGPNQCWSADFVSDKLHPEPICEVHAILRVWASPELKPWRP